MSSRSTVLVVGASASIGATVVAAFAAASDRIVATYHLTPIHDPPPNVQSTKLDIASTQSRSSFVHECDTAGVRFDTVVLMAGAIAGKNLASYTEAEARRVVDINFTDQALLIKDIAPLFAPAARLLIVSSISAERGSFDPFYAAGKGALLPFAKSLASARGERWTTLVVLPGAIEGSRMFEEMSEATQQRHRDQSPRAELLNDKDLAQILVDLSAPHWRHANGAIIRVNGGSYV